MRSSNDQLRSTIAQEAAEWFVVNRGGEVSEGERAAFETWLRTSPLHIEEYLKTATISRDLHVALEDLEVDVNSLIEEAKSYAEPAVVSLWSRGHGAATEMESRARARPTLFIGVAAALVLGLIGALWIQRDGERFGIPKTFETAHGEQRSWVLPDGSKLDINSDTAVTVRYSHSERLVRIDRGQAFFRVAHESQRRFRVISGGSGVIAVGTEFDVFRKGGSTLVTVVEGKVAVYTGAVPPPTIRAALPLQTLSVSAGEQAQVSDDLKPAKLSVANVQRAVAWVQGQIAFDRRPLGEVAEEFNRYIAVPIIIQSDRLRELPISGTFRTYDADAFIAFISRLGGVKIESNSSHILVLDEPNGASVFRSPD